MHKEFPKTLFFKISHKKIIDELNLEPSSFYFMSKYLKTPQKFTKAFNKMKLVIWIVKKLYRLYSSVKSYHYDISYQKRRPLMLLYVSDSKQGLFQSMNFIRNAQRTNKRMDFKICIKQSLNCKMFTDRIGRDRLARIKFPSLVILSHPQKSFDQAVYIRSYAEVNRLLAQTIQLFRKDYYNKKLVPRKFSGKIPITETSPDKPQQLVKKTLSSFMRLRKQQDLIIFFYDSRKCYQSCKDKSADKVYCQDVGDTYPSEISSNCQIFINNMSLVIKNYLMRSKDLNRDRKFGYFDIGENSYGSLKIDYKQPIMRVYEATNFSKFYEYGITNLKTMVQNSSDFILRLESDWIKKDNLILGSEESIEDLIKDL